jgi:hypothetical protein
VDEVVSLADERYQEMITYLVKSRRAKLMRFPENMHEILGLMIVKPKTRVFVTAGEFQIARYLFTNFVFDTKSQVVMKVMHHQNLISLQNGSEIQFIVRDAEKFRGHADFIVAEYPSPGYYNTFIASLTPPEPKYVTVKLELYPAAKTRTHAKFSYPRCR